MSRTFWDGKPWQAFKTFAILFSFIMNLVLLIVLLLLAPNILPLVSNSVKPIVGGLNQSFVDLSGATISQTIPVNDNIPIAFTLPLEETTTVTIVENVPLEGIPASFILPEGGGTINGQVFLSLPEGLALPVALALDVNVDQEIPIKLDVPVKIRLADTELGGPFNTLQNLFSPLDSLLRGLPSDNDELMRRISNDNETVEQPLSIDVETAVNQASE